jgi:cytochrome c oxidase subunit 2
MNMSKFKHAISIILLLIVSTVGLYIFFRYFLFRLPLAASEQAGPIDQMTDIHFWMQAFLFSLIMVIMLYAVYAFRRQPGDNTEGPHTHGNTGLEILWTVVPTLTVIGFGIYGAVVLNDLLAPEPGERSIEVVGRQWSWKFIYPDIDGKSSNEMGLLVNEPVVLRMRSEDVIHSFWVPEFRVKQDLLPAGNPDMQINYQVLRFMPTVEGTYKVRCAEMCGLQHSQMFATVRVMNQADYDVWREEIASKPGLEELEGMTPEERGAFWYEEFGCNACHSLDGTRLAGPTWLGLYGREEILDDGTTVIADEVYLHDSILDPNKQIVATYNPGVMPDNFEERFNAVGFGNADLITNDLVAFIKTINTEAEESSE